MSDDRRNTIRHSINDIMLCFCIVNVLADLQVERETLGEWAVQPILATRPTQPKSALKMQKKFRISI